MAVKKITESWETDSTKETATEISKPRKFTIEFDEGDNPLARSLLALNATTPELSIPQQGSQHPYNRNMVLIEKNSNVKEGPFIYEVTCSYSSSTDSDKKEGTIDPLKQKPQISWTFATSNEQVDRDIDDKPILNSSEESFDPPIMKEMHDLVLQYVRNERNFDPNIALKYKGAVNADTFFGVEPGLVMCTVFNGDKIYDDKWGDYYRVTYEFQFRLEEIRGKKYGWLRRILDQGFKTMTITGGYGEREYTNICDKNGQLISQPVLLDGKGDVLIGGPTKAVYIPYDLYRKISFSGLDIRV